MSIVHCCQRVSQRSVGFGFWRRNAGEDLRVGPTRSAGCRLNPFDDGRPFCARREAAAGGSRHVRGSGGWPEFERGDVGGVLVGPVVVGHEPFDADVRGRRTRRCHGLERNPAGRAAASQRRGQDLGVAAETGMVIDHRVDVVEPDPGPLLRAAPGPSAGRAPSTRHRRGSRPTFFDVRSAMTSSPGRSAVHSGPHVEAGRA